MLALQTGLAAPPSFRLHRPATGRAPKILKLDELTLRCVLHQGDQGHCLGTLPAEVRAAREACCEAALQRQPRCCNPADRRPSGAGPLRQVPAAGWRHGAAAVGAGARAGGAAAQHRRRPHPPHLPPRRPGAPGALQGGFPCWVQVHATVRSRRGLSVGPAPLHALCCRQQHRPDRALSPPAAPPTWCRTFVVQVWDAVSEALQQQVRAVDRKLSVLRLQTTGAASPLHTPGYGAKGPVGLPLRRRALRVQPAAGRLPSQLPKQGSSKHWCCVPMLCGR